MLESSRWLHQWKVRAADREVGTVLDFAFDPTSLRVKFWFLGNGALSRFRDVVLPVENILADESTPGILHASLKAAELRSMPAYIETRSAPRTAPEELTPASLWRWLVHPDQDDLFWHSAPDTPSTSSDRRRWTPLTPPLRLWTSDELAGYSVQSDSGEIGRLVAFLVEMHRSAVSYLIMDRSGGRPGIRTIIPLSRVTVIDEGQRRLWFTKRRPFTSASAILGERGLHEVTDTWRWAHHAGWRKLPNRSRDSADHRTFRPYMEEK